MYKATLEDNHNDLVLIGYPQYPLAHPTYVLAYRDTVSCCSTT